MTRFALIGRERWTPIKHLQPQHTFIQSIMSVKQGELDITLHLPNASIWDQAIQCACAIYKTEDTITANPVVKPSPCVPDQVLHLYLLLLLFLVILCLAILAEGTSLSIFIYRTMRQVDKVVYETECFIHRQQQRRSR